MDKYMKMVDSKIEHYRSIYGEITCLDYDNCIIYSDRLAKFMSIDDAKNCDYHHFEDGDQVLVCCDTATQEKFGQTFNVGSSYVLGFYCIKGMSIDQVLCFLKKLIDIDLYNAYEDKQDFLETYNKLKKD